MVIKPGFELRPTDFQFHMIPSTLYCFSSLLELVSVGNLETETLVFDHSLTTFYFFYFFIPHLRCYKFDSSYFRIHEPLMTSFDFSPCLAQVGMINHFKNYLLYYQWINNFLTVDLCASNVRVIKFPDLILLFQNLLTSWLYI